MNENLYEKEAFYKKLNMLNERLAMVNINHWYYDQMKY
jgi:hypothetical protein